MATQQAPHTGRVVQVIGPVVDIEFADGHLPDIYNAVRVVSGSTGAGPMPWRTESKAVSPHPPRHTSTPASQSGRRENSRVADRPMACSRAGVTPRVPPAP